MTDVRCGHTRRLRRRATAGAVLAAGWLAAGCAGAPPPDPAGTFAPERFFEGASVSRGEIRTLLVFTEAFTADFAGTTTGENLTLDERFHFGDGDRLQRWDLRPTPGGRYGGTVETEDGEGRLASKVAVEGYKTARGVVLDYDGTAPGGGAMRLHFRHWMEAQGDGTVLNRVRISKLGIPIAGADVVFSKVAKPAAGS